MTSESSVISDLLGHITGAPFAIDDPQENRLLLGKQALWFIWCSDMAYSYETRALKAAWKGRDGRIWLETSKIADMIELVERRYGQASLVRMPDGKPGVAPSGRLPDEVTNFPGIVNLLKDCEKKVAEVSEKTGIEAKVLYDGGEGVTTFRIGAKIESPSADEEVLRRQIITTAKVLKEAYDSVLQIMAD